MTRELIIEGQHVDLAPNTDITFEYTNGIVGEIGKISLAHSYTAKLPKTARNARILDDPGNVGHESSQTRRFLSARYYRNGIDLLGEARAYVLRTTPDGYEVALVWNTLEALQALSQSKETLNDLPGLPVLTWIGSNGITPDYTGATPGSSSGGAFFAWYNSGLGATHYPDVNAATHPCMNVQNLVERILSGAGVPYELSERAESAMHNAVVLAAPGHAPNRAMEAESGSVAGAVSLERREANEDLGIIEKTVLRMRDWQHGWDAPSDGEAAATNTDFTTGENGIHRVLMNLQTSDSVNLANCEVRIYGTSLPGTTSIDSEVLHVAYFKRNAAGWYISFDEEINLSGWLYYLIQIDINEIVSVTFSKYNPDLPLFSANRVHEAIEISKDNRFPLQGNLPDIGQWDFIKACMAMFGLTPVIQEGRLHLLTTDELLAKGDAYDWTSKVDMKDRAPQDMGYSLDGWAQRNLITFVEDAPLSFDPSASVEVQDTTLPESRELYELPFAASMQNNAIHYKLTELESEAAAASEEPATAAEEPEGDSGTTEGGSDSSGETDTETPGTGERNVTPTWEAEDVDIEPRIFRAILSTKGQQLYFSDDLYGQGLATARYSALQEAVRRPVKIQEHIRLNELDIAHLDLTRPVYLGQYGQYYAILKIQTSDTDLCKVELLQLR